MIHWLSGILRIQHLDDWYRVSWQQIGRVLSPLFFGTNSLEWMLQEVYPNHIWNVSKLQTKLGNMKASQRMLVQITKEIFPDSGEILSPKLNILKKIKKTP
jgi:hypothetical protein